MTTTPTTEQQLPTFGLIQIERPDADGGLTGCLGHNKLDLLDDLTPAQLYRLSADAQAAADYLSPIEDGARHAWTVMAEAQGTTLEAVAERAGVDLDNGSMADGLRINAELAKGLSAVTSVDVRASRAEAQR